MNGKHCRHKIRYRDKLGAMIAIASTQAAAARGVKGRDENDGYVMAVMWLNQHEWLTADEVAANTNHEYGGWITWQAAAAALKRCCHAGLIYRKRLGEGESRSAWAYHLKRVY